MTADVAVVDLGNKAFDEAVDRDAYPLAQRHERADACPACAAVNGMVFDRRDEAYARYLGKLHINCHGWWSFIGRDEVDGDGNPIRPNFQEPERALLEKHGHFIIRPDRYQPLNVPNFVEGREFVFKRVKDAATGQMRSVLVWNLPPREIPGLLPGTQQLLGRGFSAISVPEEAAFTQTLLSMPAPSQEERLRAFLALRSDPAGLRPGFTLGDVEAVARYLRALEPRAFLSHPAWSAIREANNASFGIAWHEAREIEDLLKTGADLASPRRDQLLWQKAHEAAVVAEMTYWALYARREGFELSAEALIAALPVTEKEKDYRLGILGKRAAEQEEVEKARRFLGRIGLR